MIKLTAKSNSSVISQALSSDDRLRPVTGLSVKAELVGSQRWSNLYVVSMSDTSVTEAELTDRIGAGNIEYVEPDYFIEFYDYPTDPHFPNQWYMENTGQDYLGVDRRGGDFNDNQILKNGVPGADINITGFYQSPPPGTTKVVVAVIDTGVDMLHPELAGKIWTNPDEIAGNGIDDDHNGYIDDTVGYDVSGDSLDILNIVGDNDPTDTHGHGTHIAGVIASLSDGVGIAGIAPRVEIMPVKTQPNATSSIGASGIVYAVNSGARVINISWGSPFESLILKEAIDFARENGVFISIAAGNSGTNDPNYPASFEGSFAVGAGNSAGYMTGFSTYGPQIDLVAPGEDILSLRADGTDMYGEDNEPGVHIVDAVEGDSLYYLSDGTSMAAPIVAGAAALMLTFRPDVSLDQLELILRAGAVDLVDPLNMGDTLAGQDTISGYGWLNIGNSYELLFNGGIHIVEPLRGNRYTGAVPIKIAPAGPYSGGWELEYSMDAGFSWTLVASGASLPPDSIAFVFDQPDTSGQVLLRLTDDFSKSSTLPFTYVREDNFLITSPLPGEEMKYNVAITGNVFGPNYDSLTIHYRNGEGDKYIATETREFFGSLIMNWSVSGVDPGFYDLVFRCYFGPQVESTLVNINLLSSYTAGWPQPLSGRGALSAVCSDLNGDGMKEVIIGTVNGLNVFGADGVPLEGFPALPEMDMRSIPAIYDVDRDGDDEIICTNEDGIHVFNQDGSYADGWPQSCPTGVLSGGYPQPTVTRLGASEDSAIVIIASDGQIYAYEFNGDSYFYSLQGYYGTFAPFETNAYYYGGNAVSAADLIGDGINEVVVSFSSLVPFSGIGLFESRTGQPAFDMPLPQTLTAPVVYGIVLADMDNDSLPEIVLNGHDEAGDTKIWVTTQADENLPGWPVTIPDAEAWLGSHPTVADLNLDGVPEVLVTFFEFDIAALYIFNADGSPYISREGRPPGEAYFAPMTFGIPMVADLTGDTYPEIVFRSGYILPGTGPERLHILDHTGNPLPGWPINTATRQSTVFSTPFVPLIDDIDNDGMVELVLIGEANDVFIWDFTAPFNGGMNGARLFNDNLNSSIYRPDLISSTSTGKVVAK